MTVFISHAREDAAAAVRLGDELAADGIDCKLDPELPEGDPFWREALARCFEEVEVLVGLHSAQAMASPWVEQEQRAYAGSKVWIALDATLPWPGAFTVAPRDALQTIRAAVRQPRLKRRAARRRQHAGRQGIAGERLLRMRDEELRLDRWLQRLAGRGRREVEWAGETAWLADGGLELRRLPAGDGADNDYLGVAPLTNRQYRQFMDASGYPAPPTWQRAAFGADDAPVTGIHWFEACACAAWFGGELPSEAAWARAAHGGDAAVRYATASGALDPEVAHYAQPFGAVPPLPVAAHPPSRNGYQGLAGNVWDWCASAWGRHRVIRGGGCMDSAAFCEVGARYRNAPIDRDCCVGFRVLLRPSQRC